MLTSLFDTTSKIILSIFGGIILGAIVCVLLSVLLLWWSWPALMLLWVFDVPAWPAVAFYIAGVLWGKWS